jgi:hypothetical protein
MLVIGGTGSPFRDMSHGMRDDDFRALLILHELGHLTGQFGPDTGSTANLNPIYTDSVKKACFQ